MSTELAKTKELRPVSFGVAMWCGVVVSACCTKPKKARFFFSITSSARRYGDNLRAWRVQTKIAVGRLFADTREDTRDSCLSMHMKNGVARLLYTAVVKNPLKQCMLPLNRNNVDRLSKNSIKVS